MKTVTMMNLPACASATICAFAPMLHDLRMNADDDLERETRDTWLDIAEEAEISGDGLDYDGPLTWA